MRNGANLILRLESGKNVRMKRKFIIIRVYCSAAVNCAPDDAMLFNGEKGPVSVYSIPPTTRLRRISLSFYFIYSPCLRAEIKMECRAGPEEPMKL